MAETEVPDQKCHCCGRKVSRLHLMLYSDELLCDDCAEDAASEYEDE